MTAQDGLQLFVKLAEAAQRTICPVPPIQRIMGRAHKGETSAD